MNDTIPILEQFIEPSPVRFSPDAPGWYALGIISLLILLVISYFIWNNYRRNRYRRNALNWLEQKETKMLNNQEYSSLVYTANMLVKEIIIRLNGREETASLRGKAWFDYLNKTCSHASFSSEDEKIEYAIYEANGELNKQDVLAFTSKIKYWIRKHRIRP